jgi:bifunctional pyridoxal-dependent enzyme with beta-cystathionase and maltose regulon repressor activities
MAEISISNSDWDRLKLKVQRKYNHLTAVDLAYEEGQEEELITRLMNRIKRNREYVIFTLRKGLINIDTNRL